MAHHPNLLPGIVASNVVNATEPATPSPPSVTNSCTQATFTWTAPADNGAAITKYGYQISTNGGSSWATEVETTSLSVAISNQYSATAYNVRVRAFNSIGWGSYSTASAANTVWAYSAYNADYGISRGCSAGCFCGTQYGTEYGTQSRTCYQWTKAGCTSLTGQGCTLGGASYSGGCQGMSGCGSFNYVQPGQINYTGYMQQLYGGDYRWISISYGGGWTDAYSVCGPCSGQGANCSSCGAEYLTFSTYDVYQCSSTGEYRYVFTGCYCYEA
jgi:hypothetical protein